MKSHPPVTLRYFDARGRAQFIRYYLMAREIPHTDERVPLSADFREWTAMRDDANRTGPFRKLPVLHYGDQMLAEALVIAAFLHQQTGDAGLLAAEENLQHQMLISSLYTDVMTQVGIMIWAELMFKNIDLPEMVKSLLQRVRRHLEVLDDTLEQWQWLKHLENRRLMLADCFLWDQLTTANDVFGAHLRLEDFQTLSRFHAKCPQRARFLELLQSHPCQITGRPGEAAALDTLRNYLK